MSQVDKTLNELLRQQAEIKLKIAAAKKKKEEEEAAAAAAAGAAAAAASSSSSSSSSASSSAAAAAPATPPSSAAAAAAPAPAPAAVEVSKEYLVWRLKTPLTKAFAYDSTITDDLDRMEFGRHRKLYVGALVEWPNKNGQRRTGTVLTLQTRGRGDKRYPVAVVVRNAKKKVVVEIRVSVLLRTGGQRMAWGGFKLREESIFNKGDTVRVRRLEEFEPNEATKTTGPFGRRKKGRPSTFGTKPMRGGGWLTSGEWNWIGDEIGVIVKVGESGSTIEFARGAQKPAPFITVRFENGEEALFTEYQLRKQKETMALPAAGASSSSSSSSSSSAAAPGPDVQFMQEESLNKRLQRGAIDAIEVFDSSDDEGGGGAGGAGGGLPKKRVVRFEVGKFYLLNWPVERWYKVVRRKGNRVDFESRTGDFIGRKSTFSRDALVDVYEEVVPYTRMFNDEGKEVLVYVHSSSGVSVPPAAGGGLPKKRGRDESSISSTDLAFAGFDSDSDSSDLFDDDNDDDNDDDEGEGAAARKKQRMELWERLQQIRLEGADKYGTLRL